MKAHRSLLFVIGSLIFLSGCVTSNSYHVDQNLLQQSQVFKSTQVPSFTMKLSDTFKYIGQINFSKSDTDHSYRYYSHNFINEIEEFVVAIQMITLNTGEWNVYRPWKWDLGKETHGEKPFYCGTSMYNLKLSKKEQEMYKPYKIFNGTKMTSKIWVYTPGGIMGGTRIVIRYFEQGNKTNNLSAFAKRADKNVVFKMGNKLFVAK